MIRFELVQQRRTFFKIHNNRDGGTRSMYGSHTKGERCKNPTMEGSHFCQIHQQQRYGDLYRLMHTNHQIEKKCQPYLDQLIEQS